MTPSHTTSNSEQEDNAMRNPTTERELLIEALHTVARMSVLLNDISGATYRKSGDKEPPKWLHDLLLRRFTDCSGVHLFIAADNIGIPLPKSLRGEEPTP